MIDLKQLRANPDRFKQGARDKGVDVDIERLVKLDEELRAIKTDMETRRAEQNRLSKEIGPQIGKLKGQLKAAQGADRDGIESQIRELEQKPVKLKTEVQAFADKLSSLEPQLMEILLKVPLPPDPDVPKGQGAEDNKQIRSWNPKWFDPAKSFEA